MAAKKPVLSVKRFSGWSGEHQADALKFYGNTTPEAFKKLSPAAQRALLASVRGKSLAASAPDSATAPQTVDSINRAAQDAAALKYAPSQQALSDEQKISAAQQGRITDWFGEYQQKLKDIQAQTGAAYDAAKQGVADTATNNETIANAQSKAQSAQAAADAQSRGATVDPGIQAKADEATANRKDLLSSIASVIGGQKANNVAYQGARQETAVNQAVGAHVGESSNAANLRAKLRDLLAEKGQYENTTRQDLISNERKNYLENATLQSTILNNTAKVAQDAADTTAKAKAKSAEVNKYGYTNKEWQAMTSAERQSAMLSYDKQHKDATTTPKDPKQKKPATGPGSLTTDAENKLVGKVNSYLSQFTTPPMKYRDPADKTKGMVKMTKDEVYRSLLQSGADARIVQVADSLYRNDGSIGPNGIKQAHALGIHVNGRWKPSKKKTTATVVNDAISSVGNAVSGL
jgi:hypothetical protein